MTGCFADKTICDICLVKSDHPKVGPRLFGKKFLLILLGGLISLFPICRVVDISFTATYSSLSLMTKTGPQKGNK